MARKYETWRDIEQECHRRCQWWCKALAVLKRRVMVATPIQYVEEIPGPESDSVIAVGAAGLEMQCRRCGSTVAAGRDGSEIERES